MNTNDIKPYKVVKLVQLAFLIIMAVITFLILILNPSLRYSVYQNMTLTILYFSIWILLIVEFLFLLYDLSRMEHMASTSHELKKATYLDNLTGIPNRYSCDLIFQSYNTEKSIEDIGCCVLTIRNLLDVNQTKSHEEGDAIILNFCSLFESVGDRYGFVGRNGGNEFLIVIDHCSEALMNEFLEQLNEELDAYNRLHLDKLQIAYEYALNQSEHVSRFADLVAICCNRLLKTDAR